MKVSDIREHFISELKNENFTIDKTGAKTIELIGASFTADEPSIFGTPNQEYIDKEIAWYKSMSNNINDIKSTIFSISNNIFDIIRRVGMNSIFDSLLLITKNPIKKILSYYNDNDKDRNLVYFYNNVFIPISVDIYEHNNIGVGDNSIIPYNNKNISKKNYDIKNIHVT